MTSRRINQLVFSVISGLLFVGSTLLIIWKPPDQRGNKATAPASKGEISTRELSADSGVVADALSPANLLAGSPNNSENPPSSTATGHLELNRPESDAVNSSSSRQSRILQESGLVTIRHVPLSDSEVETAWKNAAGYSCEFVPPNEPFEITRPTLFLTDNDRRQAKNRTLTPGMRQHILSIGLYLPREVEQSLPLLGKIPITDYIRRHYVTIQARVHRDPLSGIAYLSHRPMAATMQYSGSKVTLEFTDTVARSVNDFRSLGLWLRPEEDVVVQNLRTLVLADQYETSETGVTNSKRASACELMFVRARYLNKRTAAGKHTYSNSAVAMAENGVSNLILHTFVTTNGRRLLHHISADSELRNSQQCGIKALVKFTSFAFGVYPTGSVVVGQEVRSNSTYSEETLNRFAQQKGWADGPFEHLSQLLDAIIDKELMADDNQLR